MNRELVGRFLGYILIVLVILGVPYIAGSFVFWSMDPSVWPVGGRIVFTIASAILATLWLLSKLPPNEE